MADLKSSIFFLILLAEFEVIKNIKRDGNKNEKTLK